MGTEILVYLVILAIALALSYALRPKPKTAKPAEFDAPTTDEGTGVKEFYGTCWVGDPMVTAAKLVSTIAIKKST